MASSNESSSSDSSQPSLLGGHVKYVQGAVSSALGSSTGESTKSSAVQEMRDAKSQSESQSDEPQPPQQSTLLGTVENMAGKVTGCEGMAEDGARRVPEKRGVEETSGTG